MRKIILVILIAVGTILAYDMTSDLAPTQQVVDGITPSNPNPSPLIITWTLKTPGVAPARYWCPGTGVVRDTIYFLGGRTSAAVSINSIHAYVPATDVWISTGLPTLLTPRRAGGGGRIGNKIYVAGGRDAASTTLSTCEEFDVDTRTVTTKASMPAVRWACGSGVAGGKLYIIGDENRTGTLYEYDPATNTWATKAPLSIGRGWTAAAGAGGKLYVLGGAGATAGLSDCWEYNPATNTWTAKANMPGPREYHIACAFDDTLIFVFGGNATGAGAADNVVYRYHIPSNTWTTETPMLTPRGWQMANQVGNKLYISYGSDTSTPTYLTANEEGLLAAPPPPPPNDVGVDAILVPGATHRINTAMIPLVRVKNYGAQTQTNFPVVCSIVGATGALLSTSTVNVPSLASGDTYRLNFASWTPTVAQLCTVKVRTNLATDTVLANDRKTRTTLIGDWLLMEGFNSTTWPPTGWLAIPIVGTYNWVRNVTNTNPTCTPYEGEAMASYQSYSATSGNSARLISSPITIGTTAQMCSVKFYMYHDPTYPGPTDLGPDSIKVEYSTDGTNFTRVAAFRRYEAVTQWTEHAVYLGTFSGTIYAGFLAVSQYGSNMNMDYVRMFGYQTGIEEDNSNKLPKITSLSAPKPNPITNGLAKISFSISEPTKASLKIYDASGRMVRTLVNSKLDRGIYNLTWNGTDDNNNAVAEGIYFYTLTTDNNNYTKKLVFTR